MKRLFLVFFFIVLLSGCVPKATITLDEGMDTVEVYDIYQIRGCTVTIGENEYSMRVVNNPVDNEVIGEYIIEYEKEVNGKTYDCQRVVFVVDQTKPVVVLNPGIDTIIVGEEWTDAGVTVSDNYDSDVLVSLDDSALNILVEGTYEVYYNAIDDSGNITTITRVVHVISGD